MDQITTRLDHTINDDHRVFFRWSLNNNRLSEPGGSPALGVAEFVDARSELHSQHHQQPASEVVNEFRFNTLYGLISLNPYLLGRDFNKEAGIRRSGRDAAKFRYRFFPGLQLVRIYESNGFGVRSTAEDAGPLHARVRG